MTRNNPFRIRCTADGYDLSSNNDTVIGTCPGTIQGKDEAGARKLAEQQGWTLDPQPLCPQPHTKPSERPVLVLEYPHDDLRCICDPNDLFDPPNPRPRAVAGCPAHRARRAAQRFAERHAADTPTDS